MKAFLIIFFLCFSCVQKEKEIEVNCLEKSINKKCQLDNESETDPLCTPLEESVITCINEKASSTIAWKKMMCLADGSGHVTIEDCQINLCEDQYHIENNSCVLTNTAPATQFVDLGQSWMFLGDSQTAGRASSTPSVSSHVTALVSINFEVVDFRGLGVGGRNLEGHYNAYIGSGNLTGLSWVHFQESGNQNNNGQRSVAEYISTFETFVRRIRIESPQAIISTETAFSFGREATSYRNWDSYNIALREKVLELSGDGIQVYIAEVDDYIKKADVLFGAENIWFQDGQENAFHYTGIGNLVVALAINQAMGRDISQTNLSAIPSSEISRDDKTKILSLF